MFKNSLLIEEQYGSHFANANLLSEYLLFESASNTITSSSFRPHALYNALLNNVDNFRYVTSYPDNLQKILIKSLSNTFQMCEEWVEDTISAVKQEYQNLSEQQSKLEAESDSPLVQHFSPNASLPNASLDTLRSYTEFYISGNPIAVPIYQNCTFNFYPQPDSSISADYALPEE
ncbi:MAG: hypothetical protein DGJ47_000190 [Rickettsiaceae bacterium]